MRSAREVFCASLVQLEYVYSSAPQRQHANAFGVTDEFNLTRLALGKKKGLSALWEDETAVSWQGEPHHGAFIWQEDRGHSGL